MRLWEFLQEKKEAPLLLNATHIAPRSSENNHNDFLSEVL